MKDKSVYENSPRFRLYPTKKQAKQIENNFSCCRYVYNEFLAYRTDRYKYLYELINADACAKILTQIKKSKTWLAEADRYALIETLKELDISFKNFFAKRCNYPKFKQRKNPKQTYKTIQTYITADGKVKLPKIGFVKAKITKEICGKITSVKIIRECSSKYYAVFCLKNPEIKSIGESNGTIGIDVGIKNFCTFSNGKKIARPEMPKSYTKRLMLLQRKLSKAKSGSKNRDKIKVLLQKHYKKKANKITDFIHKLSTSIVRENQTIAIENLNVKGLLKNHNVAKSISDSCWSAFFKMLLYKSKKYGRKLIKVDRFFASSQLCSECGFKNTKVSNLDVREWTCPKCGANHDRDINAAKNILNEALSC